jgi:putative transport protein
MIGMIEGLHGLLADSVLIRLFVIIALGYFLGEIRLPGNFRFGVAAVLFVGLGFGVWDRAMVLPMEFQTLGLVLFVYCVGLDAAAGFFQCLRKDGLRFNLAAAGILSAIAAVAWIAMQAGGRPGGMILGVFCGSMTNTPALGSVVEALEKQGASAEAMDAVTVGYGVVYPFAIITVLLLMQLRWKWAPVSLKKEGGLALPPVTILIQKSDIDGKVWTTEAVRERTGLLVTRYCLPGGEVQLLAGEVELPAGSQIVAVGDARQRKEGLALLGREADEPLHLNMQGFQLHRYFVSNPEVAGKAIRELEMEKRGAVVSRVRRGDVDLPVRDDLVLHLGDRVRVVSYHETEPVVRKFFGNSLQIMTEGGYFSFAVGILLGLLLGQVPIPLPGLAEPVRLGSAGGPLIVALLLGNLGRTGPFIWNLPASVNLTLRQLGILFFLAGVGVRAGGGLLETIRTDGLFLITLGVGMTLAAHLLLWKILAWMGEKDIAVAFGLSSALQTQPAALTFAGERVDRGALNAAYASLYPLCLILKVVLVQILLLTG